MPPRRDDGLSALFETEAIQAIGIIGAISQDFSGAQPTQQITSRSHVILLTGTKLKAYRKTKRIHYRMDFGSKSTARAAKSLGLRSPLLRGAPPA